MSQTPLSRICQAILRPDVLFTIATFQGLLPYAFWPFGVGLAIRSSELTYRPAAIILLGWLAFLFGCSLVWSRLDPLPRFELFQKEKQLTRALWGFCIAGFVQVFFVVRVYGALPILSYLREDNQIDVGTATELQQDSFLGQFALFVLTTMILGALLLIMALIAVEKRKKVPFAFYLGAIATLAMTLINGKRAGMVQLIVLLGAGLALFGKDVLGNLTVAIPFFKTRKVALWTVAGVVLGLFSVMGPLAEIRNQGRIQQSSTAEFIGYQEGPIRNMEEQTRIAGFGPNHFILAGPLQALIPVKLIPESLFAQEPPRADQSSPSGFYEYLQWFWGLPGIIMMPACLGAFSMWLYKNSRKHAAYFLCYCQIVLPLLMSHSFNLFLIAPLVAVPCICFALLGTWLNTPKSIRNLK